MNKYFALALSLILLTGCASTQPPSQASTNDEQVRIDASTDERYIATYSDMLKTLNEKERTFLFVSIVKVNLAGVAKTYPSAIFVPKEMKVSSDASNATRAKLHGLSYQEILQLAQNISEVTFSRDGLPVDLTTETLPEIL